MGAYGEVEARVLDAAVCVDGIASWAQQPDQGHRRPCWQVAQNPAFVRQPVRLGVLASRSYRKKRRGPSLTRAAPDTDSDHALLYTSLKKHRQWCRSHLERSAALASLLEEYPTSR